MDQQTKTYRKFQVDIKDFKIIKQIESGKGGWGFVWNKNSFI